MSSSSHSDNWAVLVCTSTFWFNYRHMANVLSIYSMIKRRGIRDDRIILMLADDVACNARNVLPGTVFNHYNHELNVYNDDVEVKYRGIEVTVDNFIRVITNRLPRSTSTSKRLLSDRRSNVLIYMTGHGGENFLKFQDAQEITSQDLAHSIQQMEEGGRFNNLLLIVDTCQAKSMCDNIVTPGVTCLASSLTGESSYSYQVDEELGVAVLDRFTWAMLELGKMLEDPSHISKALKKGATTLSLKEESLTIQDLFDLMDPKFLGCHPSLLPSQPPSLSPTELLFTDFFSSTKKEIIEIRNTDLHNSLSSPSESLKRLPRNKIRIDSIFNDYNHNHGLNHQIIPSTIIGKSFDNNYQLIFIISFFIIFMTSFFITGKGRK